MADQNTAPTVEPSTHTPVVGGVDETVDAKRVFIGNVSFTSTQEQVEEFVKQGGGSVVQVELPTTYGGRPGGFAFVEYATESDAASAIEKLQGLTFNEREVTVALAKPASVKKKERAEKAAIRKAKKKAERSEKAVEATGSEPVAQASASAGATAVVGEDGEVKKTKKKSKSKSRRGRRQPEAGDDAPAEDGQTEGEVKKSAARIDDAVDGAGAAKHDRKPKEKRFTNTGELSKTLVFVANLPFEVDDAGLSNLFTELNLDVKSARIITKPNFRNKEGPPRSKGFGFVEVANEEQQKAAVEKLTGYKFGEREITIKVANTRAPIEGVEGAEGVTEQA